MPIDEQTVREYLRVKDGRIHHREGQELEFKEQFNLAGLVEYFKDFAAFANNQGGYLICGVTDKPRRATGLSTKAIEQFEKIDPERISGFLLEIFSGDIRWQQELIEAHSVNFGVFRVEEAAVKPIVAKKDEGKDQEIKNGEIYYRYGGRTQKIQHAELERIIDRRVEHNNREWLDLMGKIGRAGPTNAAVLDTEKGLIEKNDSRILVLDEKLAGKMKFIKEGHFSEREGAATLKLVGDVVPVDKVEVIQKVKESLTKRYPLSAMELVSEVQKRLPNARRHDVWDVITANDLKNNSDYSVYNFRNKMQEDKFNETGKVPSVTPSIYNSATVDFIAKVISTRKTEDSDEEPNKAVHTKG